MANAAAVVTVCLVTCAILTLVAIALPWNRAQYFVPSVVYVEMKWDMYLWSLCESHREAHGDQPWSNTTCLPMKCFEGSRNATADEGNAALACGLLTWSQVFAVVACCFSVAAAAGWSCSHLVLCRSCTNSRNIGNVRRLAVFAASVACVSSILATFIYLGFEYNFADVYADEVGEGWFTENWSSSGWFVMLTACILELLLQLGFLAAYKRTGRPVWRSHEPAASASVPMASLGVGSVMVLAGDDDVSSRTAIHQLAGLE